MKKLIPLLLIIALVFSSCGIPFLSENGYSLNEDVSLPTKHDYSDNKEVSFDENAITGYGFYYNQLSEDEQSVYSSIYELSEVFSNELYLPSISYDSFYKIIYALSYDNPDLFWINGEYNVTSVDGYVTKVTFTSFPNNAEEISEEIGSITDDIISQIPEDSDDYMKLKYIYDWIIDNTEYKNGDRDQNICSVFLEKESVCAGYSKAFQYLCDKAGLPCTFISGEAKGGSHAWNLIYLDNNYYWVDVTWGDPVYANDGSYEEPNYGYFCVTDDQLFRTHKLYHAFDEDNFSPDDNVFTYPECTSDNFNYYMINGCYFYTYDRDVLDAFILQKLQTEEGEILIDMQYADEGSWNEALSDIISEDSTSHVGQLIKDYYDNNSWFDVMTYTVSYSYNEDTLTFRIKVNTSV